MSKDEKEEPKPSAPGRGLSRRAFLTRAGAATVAGTAATFAGPMVIAEAQKAPEAAAAEESSIPGLVPVTLQVNGTTHKVRVDPRATVLDTLRETLHLTGTKKGCDHGQCGACTIHVNGRRVNSCLLLATMQQGKAITTIEGLGTPEAMHPVQAAFAEHDAFQCGYCTSGQMMSAAAMLHEPWGERDEDVQEALSGNICRCGAYPNIIAAVQSCRRKAMA